LGYTFTAHSSFSGLGMKYNYLLAAFLAGALAQSAQAQTTAWRPFRPGFIYGFAQAASPTTLHTLRVDSAYATAGGDSVYTFNRLMRPLPGTTYQYSKSRNNLLGARLRWQPGTRGFYLETNAEPALGTTQATTLLLRPRAAVGSTWAASTSPALTATLSSRALGSVGSSPDSIATISLSNGQSIVLSRSYGLVSGPQWLSLPSASSAPTWQQPAPPQAGLGSYDPRNLMSLTANDEIGYEIEDLGVFSPSCYKGYRLRRITSRTLTADSLLLTYRQQDFIATYSWPSCNNAPSAGLGAVKQGRWAFSLRTGKSPQLPYLGLLTGEYRAVSYGAALAYIYYLAQALTPPTGAVSCLTGTQQLSTLIVYGSASTPGSYSPGIDQAYSIYSISTTSGAGISYSQQGGVAERLIYYRRNGVACGSPANFTTLLPSRAAAAAAAATLHPNPAAEAATLTLAAPTRPGTVLTLTDALGRRLWSHEVAPGQTSLPVTLAGQQAGLYLVQLLAPGAAPLTWKLNHGLVGF
jgi:hypothetical protein